jgi:hypothetical protein
MSRVRCNATVDFLADLADGRRYRVVVTGLPPFAVKRVYFIKCADEDAAAFKGIEIFCDEMKHFPRLAAVT